MHAWRAWCICAILYVYLQRGQTERIRGNDLLYDDDLDYNNDLDGLSTDAWTDRNSTSSGTEVPTRTPAVTDNIANNSTSSGTSIHIANTSTPPETDVGTSDNTTRSRTGIWTDDNPHGSGTDVPTDNNVTRPATDVSTDNNVTDIPTNMHTVRSKTTTSINKVPTGIYTTPVIDISDICKNSSSPDLLLLTTTVPEGANVTLKCGSASDTSPLWWYRDHTVLQRGVGEVVLYIPDSDQSQSGSYLCTDQRGCCIVKHHLTVYGVPPYTYHLAVMGAVLAVGLPLCVFLSVRQSSRLGRYARMLNERQDEAEQLIL